MPQYNAESNAGIKIPLEILIEGMPSRKGMQIRGAYPGKTLVITAGVHGCEYPGIQAVRELMKELDPMKLYGQVLLFPLLNESGFYEGCKQLVPGDGINLNRAFPGNIQGSEASRIAAAIEQQLYPEADFLVDLHSGDINEMVTPFLFFPAHASASVTDAARAAANALSLPYRVASSAQNGLYSYAAQCGIPALLLERGGLGLWSMNEVAAYKKTLYELMEHLGILCEQPQNLSATPQMEIGEMVYLEAEEQGFWYPMISAGDTVKSGERLGELRDMDDQVIRCYLAAFDGVVLYYTVSLGVKKGDALVAYGREGG